MPQGKGTYGSKVGRPPKKSPAKKSPAKKTTVGKLKEKAKGTGWGKLTRQKDQDRLNKLLKGM